MKQLDVEVSTPAKDFRYDLQLAKTGSKSCRLVYLSRTDRQTDRQKATPKSPPCMSTGGLKNH